MADSSIILPPDSTGKPLDAGTVTTGAGTVYRERMAVGDPATGGNIAAVTNAAPGSTPFGLVTWPVTSASQPLRVDPVGTTVQPVSGTVTANLGTLNGAATAAKQPALGTAGTPSADVLTVQGAAGMTALKVDGSAVTQPVSGTVGISGTPGVNLAQIGGTALSGANVVDTVNTALRVNVVAGGASGGTSSSFGAAVPGTGTAAGFSDGTNMQLARVFDADTGAGTQYVLGVNLRKSASGGSTELAGQATMTNSIPVAIASDQSAVPASQSGTWSVRVTGNAGANLDAATGSSVPANALQSGRRAASALPASVTDGQLVAHMADTAGRAIVRSGGPRELLTANNLTLTTTTVTTLIAAGAAGVFRDLTFLQASNTSETNVRIDVSDGTRTYSWFLAANGGGFNVNFDPPLCATTAATAWTAAISAAVTDVRVSAQSVDTK